MSEFKVQSSVVPEPVEGKVRCFDKLSNRKVQSQSSALCPNATIDNTE